MAKFYATAELHDNEIRAQVSGASMTLTETSFHSIALSKEATTDLSLPPEDNVKLWEKISISRKKEYLNLYTKKKLLKEGY